MHGRELHEASDEELAHVSPHLTPAIRSVLDVRGAIAARTGHGGTAPQRVAEQLEALNHELELHEAWAAARA